VNTRYQVTIVRHFARGHAEDLGQEDMRGMLRAELARQVADAGRALLGEPEEWQEMRLAEVPGGKRLAEVADDSWTWLAVRVSAWACQPPAA
jgi:hypothetical protein